MKRIPAYLILVLVAMIVTAIAFQFPDQAGQLMEMRRGVAFEGETREIMMAVMALGIAGFVVYLMATRK